MSVGQRGWALAVKRALDIPAGLVVVAAFLPFLAVLAVLITLDSPGPVFFFQDRLGKDGRIFRVWKLRTMLVGAASGAVRDRRDPRLTRVGYWLRRFSLDEVPQFINVLRGEMSLVGPRPDRPFRLPTYTPEQRTRLEVLPGITGLAQISGRNLLTWQERCELDSWYVRHWSLGLDARILLKTIPVLISQRGIEYPEEGTV
jgi:undecaprenyl phosphate N,N'-diacetylbacillosamine 1-phosphate transferase